MILVLSVGSLRLATFSNYPGALAARWVQFRGIAPSLALIWAFNIWLVLTSAVEWAVVGLVLRLWCDACRRGAILNCRNIPLAQVCAFHSPANRGRKFTMKAL
jgi:hypothetical protein